MEIVLLIAGLAGLWFGTELTIRGAVAIAERLGMSEFVVGVALLSVGSDLPELTIAVTGAIEMLLTGAATSDVIVGSAIGSGLGQFGFVMGITGLLGYLTLPRHIVFQHGGVLVGALLVLAVTGLDGSVSRIEGATLVAIYLIYFIYLLREPWRNGHPLQHDADRPAYMLWLYLLAGLIVVVGSAELTVRTVIAVAQILNIEQSFIAVIVIGIGTSLPELSISVVAVMKKRHGLSVGNLVGSNIFDTLVPIGVAAAISTLRFNKELLQYDLTLLVALTLLVLFFFSRRKGLHKPQALVILVFYCSYALVRIGNAQIE